MPLTTVNLAQKLSQFDDAWNPRVVGELGDQLVKLVKLRGEFVWHHHDVEDELFLVLRVRMRMGLRDPDERVVAVGEGEFLIVPHGVEHCPAADTEEVALLLLEPATTLNTGNLRNDRTRDRLERI
jgi:mannose-6-phosphate isomerase-like protein (cupin superfamily)